MTVAFISKDFLESPYCEAERNLALQKALEVRHQVLIPILLNVQVADLPLAIRGLTCLSFHTEGFQTKLLQAFGVQDSDNRPSYHDLKKEVEDLKKEKCTMIQQSLQHGWQLVEKDDMIRKLKAENAALKESKLEDVKKIALELDECKRQMSVMEENLQQKGDTILQLQTENQKLKKCANTDNNTTHKQPTVLDTFTGLHNVLENKMNDMEAEEVMAFFTKVLLLLQTMMNCFCGDNTVIKKMYAAVLLWMGDRRGKDRDWNSELNYYTRALETVHELHGANMPHSDTALLLNDIGVCHYNLKSYHTAAEYFSQSLRMRKQLAGPSRMSKGLARSYGNLGAAQMKMGGCTQQGIDNLTWALEMYRTMDGDTDEDIQRCLHGLVVAYDQSGDKAKAAISFVTALVVGRGRRQLYRKECDLQHNKTTRSKTEMT